MFYQCSRIELSPLIKIRSHTEPTEEMGRLKESSKNSSSGRKIKYRLLLKSLSCKKEERIEGENSQSKGKSKKSIDCKYVLTNEKSVYMKKRKQSILKEIGLEKGKKVENLHMLEKLLTIQPTDSLKKDYLERCYHNHL